MEKNQSTITLEDLLVRFDKQTKKFINEIEQEEKNERIETLDSIINDIKAQKVHTNIQKDRFIGDIKSGLGKKIKENPNAIVIHEKPWYVKFLQSLKKLFTKF